MVLKNHNPILRSHADIAWKEVLELFFEETIAFSFPTLYADIDWSRAWDFLDKELQAITPESMDGPRFVDKLIRVHLINGHEKWLLIHIEVQGQRDPDFSKRMFVYHYRSFDKFGQHPVSCAILSDGSKIWRPAYYQHAQSGCELSFTFPILKLLDLEVRRDFLENSKNPFSCIIIAQLNAIKLKHKSAADRYQLKLSETKKLYKKGFSGITIKKLFQFLDALIRLPTDLDILFKNDIVEFEGENNMAYITSIQRLGREEGLQQGMQQGLHQIARRMLSKKQPIDFISEMTGLSATEIHLLQQQQYEQDIS